jgi:cobalt-zinc-cadmium efflux system outer membrane protein
VLHVVHARVVDVKPLLATVMTLLLAGCATYHAVPLDDRPGAQGMPTAAVLSADAAKLDRPFLTPAAVDLAAPLDANAIGLITVLENTDLKAMRAKAGITTAQAFAARLLPDPTLNLSYDRLLAGPDSLDNLAGQLVQDIALLRSRKVLAAQGRAQVEQVRLDLAWAEWQTAGAARLQAVRVVALERAVALGRASKQSAQGLLDATLRAALRGDLSSDQVQANRLASLDAADKLRANETALATARGELARLLGFPPATRLTLADSSPTLPPLDPARLFDIARLRRADLQALQAGYAAQEASVRKAVLDQFPTLSLGLGASRDTTGNKLVGAAVNFTLPLWNRNRGGIAIAEATRASLKADYEARLFQTRSDIAAAVAGIAIAQSSVSELSEQLPALQRYAAGSAKAAAQGDLARSTATLAEQTLRDRQAALVAAQQAVSEQMIALELLTGAPASTWNR